MQLLFSGSAHISSTPLSLCHGLPACLPARAHSEAKTVRDEDARLSAELRRQEEQRGKDEAVIARLTQSQLAMRALVEQLANTVEDLNAAKDAERDKAEKVGTRGAARCAALRCAVPHFLRLARPRARVH